MKRLYSIILLSLLTLGAWAYDFSEVETTYDDGHSAVKAYDCFNYYDVDYRTERFPWYSVGSPKMKAPGKVPNKTFFDYSKFKGLFVLIEWSDRSFTRENTKELVEQMVNQKNFTGYQDDLLNKYVECTGSVTDYFFDNSNGIFQPQFDVVGPIKVDCSCTQTSGGRLMYTVIKEAIDQLDKDVNFANYDVDNDGYVDYIYFLFAGYDSTIPGNNSNYVWPHSSSLSYWNDLKYDGKNLKKYSCSTEFTGSETKSEVELCSIGIICYQLCHFLGLMSHYDADYEENGQSYTPGSWDIMADGHKNNNGITPAGLNAFERWALGFATPERIQKEGVRIELESLDKSNKAYRIDTPQENEYFLLENRQQSKWDEYLPGHGLLVWRVDSTNAEAWIGNSINADPKHNYFELVRAYPDGKNSTDADPFPGTAGVSNLTNDTYPANLLSWARLRSPFSIRNISERNGKISFKIGGENELADVETFESIAVGTGNTNNVAGAFCTWDMDGATVVSASDNYGYGNQMLQLKRSGSLTSSVSDNPVSSIHFHVWNASSGDIKIILSMMEPGETKWTNIKEKDKNSTNVTLKKNTDAHLLYILEAEEGTRFRIQMLSTSNNSLAYVDNIVFNHADNGDPAIDDQEAKFIVWTNDGEQHVYLLEEEPKVSFTADELVIETTTITASYPLTSFQRITYNEGADIATSIVNATDSNDRNGESLTFADLQEGTSVSVYSSSGVLLQQFHISPSSRTLSLSSLPQGIYLVKINSKTYKIRKK